MRLALCLKKAGTALGQADRDAIMAAVAENQRSGMSEIEAARAAVDARLSFVRAQREQSNAPVQPTGTNETTARAAAPTTEATAPAGTGATTTASVPGTAASASDEAAGVEPMAAAGLKPLSSGYEWVDSVVAPDGAKHTFNVRHAGTPKVYRVTRSTTFPGTGFTGAPTQEVGKFATADQALKALAAERLKWAPDSAPLQPAQAKTGGTLVQGAATTQPTPGLEAPATLKDRLSAASKAKKANTVYKTRRAAEEARTGNTQRLRKTKDGYILRDATDKELAAAEKAGRRLGGGSVDVEKDSLLVAIAKLGGLSITERSDTIGEGNRNIGGKMLFTRTGKALDTLADEALREYGYVPQQEVNRDGGVRWLRDAIKSEFNNGTQHFSEQGLEAIMQREQAQQEAEFLASREAEDVFGDLDGDEVQASGYTAASPEIQAMTERLVAEAEALGVDVESIRERVSMATEGKTQDEYEFAVQQALIEAIEGTRSDAARRDASPAAGSSEDRGQVADRQGEEEGLTLEAQDAESLREKTTREQAARDADAAEQRRLAARDGAETRRKNKAEEDARADQVRKERADAAVAGFELGQEAPSATVSTTEAAGQGSVFDTPESATPSAAEKAAPAKKSSGAQARDGVAALFQEALKAGQRGASDLRDFVSGPTFLGKMRQLLEVPSDARIGQHAAQLVDADATARERHLNSVRGHAQELANILNAAPLLNQRLGTFNVETQRLMLPHVLALSEDSQVVQAVVQLVTVNVMDDLSSRQLAAKRFLNDPAMVKAAVAHDLRDAVTTIGDSPNAFVRTIALAGAEVSSAGVDPNLERPAQNGGTTSGTNDGDFRHGVDDTRNDGPKTRTDDAGNVAMYSRASLNTKALFRASKYDDGSDGTPTQALADATAVLGVDLRVPVREINLPSRRDMPMRYNLATRTIEYNTAVPRSRAADVEYMLEELLHALDHTGGERTVSASNLKFLPGGAFRAELEQSPSAALREQLKYPLEETGYTDTQVAAELFARVGVLYHANPELLKAAAPNTYAAYEQAFGRTGSASRLRGETRPAAGRGGGGQVLPVAPAEVRGADGRGAGVPDGATGVDGQQQSLRLRLLRGTVQRGIGGNLSGARVDFGGGAGTLETRTGASPAGSASPATGWAMPEGTRFDNFVYKFQDKNIDLKRAIAGITKERQSIEDNIDAYLQEELFHERAAKRTQDFTKDELGPVMKDMASRGITLDAMDEYLHNRHAEEANEVAAERNKDDQGNSTMPDGGSGIKTADARAYLAGLDASKRQRLETVAAKIDAIIAKTRQTLVDYGLESRTVTDGWASQFSHYVPLMREDEGDGSGTGQGFSIKGKESKSRTGSTDRKVVDILANIAMQRERAIVRGEKNRVAVAMVGLVDANPAPDFWQADYIPTERVFNDRTGLVEERQIPGFKNRPNVLVAKVAGPNGEVQERAIVFNERNPRAARMAESLKNLDAAQLEGVLGVSAKITRYFAAVNTQYNPVFGFVNFVRDVQGAIINLRSTAIKGSEKAVMKDVMPALAGIYSDVRKARRGQAATSQWATLWEEFQSEGGATGFRDLFRTSEDRANAIKREIDPTAWMNSTLGKVFTVNGNLKVPLAQAQKTAGWLFDWLSDYNLAMENAVRLSAYKVALDNGMTKQRAASLAKNLTVNFNRKGQAGMQVGAMYAFFNASMQGTARMGEVLFEGQGAGMRLSGLGRKIIYGGLALGALQAMALTAAGFDDDEPPQFVRERSLVIPYGALAGTKGYISIPMPLGWHVIPGLGRMATEFAMSGFKDPGKRLAGVVALVADAFNPIGNSGLSLQTIAPTALDPLVALTENRDWTGKPIARESFDRTTPGHALAKDTASGASKWLAETINLMSGGTKYTAGALSPTPDQIDYLWGQVTGGVGRELNKVEQTAKAGFTGEELPTHKLPLVGRFFGDAEGPTAQGTRFYENLNRINLHEAQIKGLVKDGQAAEAAQYRAENPEASLISVANMAERQMRRLRARKRELLANDAPREAIRQIEDQITQAMTRLNESVQRREKAAATL